MASAVQTIRFSGAASISAAAEWLLSELGAEVRLATPLGLGKPNPLLNAIYSRIAEEGRDAVSKRSLVLFTALSLIPPAPSEDLARKFFGPFRDRHWGPHYPELRYAADGYGNRLPANVRVYEFYFQAGAALKSDRLQRNYISVNYTHVAETIAQMGVDAILQLVARKIDRDGRERFSLASNPDLTLDVVELYRKNGKRMRVIAVVHPEMPFLGGDAEVGPEFFAAVVESPAMDHALFALPRLPIDAVDHRIGLFTSRLIRDGGTLQIGIGSLSDAVVAALLVRQKENKLYREISEELPENGGANSLLERGPFEAGLYGLSEMVTDGFMHLRQAGILKREVRDEADGARTFLHGAFFLGSKPFYEWLRTLSPEEASGLRMTRVSKVNDLYDANELLLRRQRKHPRFLNTCMQVSLLGSAASETLENGRVVSGVGGQYNFVAMSHELPDSRSVLMVRSYRVKNGKRLSNIVWAAGMATIPRHLRDIVVTEYGVADLRGQDDETCIRRMLAIADSEFQEELLATAKRNGKISPDYEIPELARANHPANIDAFAKRWRARGFFAEYPFGSDFTEVEQRIFPALTHLKKLSEGPKALALIRLAKLAIFFGREMGEPAEDFSAELSRMGLANPSGIMENLTVRALRAALRRTGRGGTG